jgi:hypothetical protein
MQAKKRTETIVSTTVKTEHDDRQARLTAQIVASFNNMSNARLRNSHATSH